MRTMGTVRIRMERDIMGKLILSMVLGAVVMLAMEDDGAAARGSLQAAALSIAGVFQK